MLKRDGEIISLDDTWNNRASAELAVMTVVPTATMRFVRDAAEVQSLNKDWEVAMPTVGKIMELNKVDCELCGSPTHYTSTKLCDRCWELERRIERDLPLARKIFERLGGRFKDERLIPLDQISKELSVRACKAIWRSKFTTMGELAGLSLMSIRGCGETTIREIMRWKDERLEQ